MLNSYRRMYCLVAVCLSLTINQTQADPLKEAIDVDIAATKAATNSQKTIDTLNDQTQQMLEQYRSATRHAETLQIYNNHLKELLNSQLAEKASLEEQLKQIEVTQREVVPLILKMLDNLEQFIKLDIPFLPEERQQRLEHLKALINRADVTHAEKFRRILEAFQIENDYGNTIEAYRGNLTLNDTVSSVDFLRLGRVALYYQRLDGSETGYWNRETNTWETLSSDHRNAIRDGLRIARKETAPDLLTLPVPAPEAGQ